MNKNDNKSSRTIQQCDIFISYRRDGGDMAAMYFYQALKERGYNVFYDLEVLRAGKFNDALLSSIQSCTDFLLILSPRALDRCNDEKDWVRQEIAEAIRRKKNIVPVMMKGFQFSEDLPDEIDDVRYQNGLTCTTEYFEESINRLCERYLRSTPVNARKKSLLLPILAALAVLGVGLGAFMMLRGRPSSPAPVPAATVEITAEPTAEPTATPTAEPTATPTAEPTATPTAEPTAEPGPLVVRDTDFPVLSRAFERMSFDKGEVSEVYELRFQNEPLPGNPAIRRRDVCSLTFLPTLADAPKDAWDISEAGDGRVLAWATPNGKLYDLYIAGDGGVKLVDADKYSRLFIGFSAMERFSLNGCVDLSERTDLSCMFCGNHALREVDLTGICTERAQNMWNMFGGCWKLEGIDLSGFDTSNVEYMNDMFLDCGSLTELDVTGFDTSRVIYASDMFWGCERLTSLDVSHMDTSQMTDVSNMFRSCKSLRSLDVSHFDTARVTDMYQMFCDCSALETLDVSGFDTSRVRSMEEMFCRCEKLRTLDVSGFDTSHTENIRAMFAKCKNLLSLDVSGFNTSRVTQMDYMFDDCPLLDDLDLSGWDTSHVTTMKAMLSACSSLYRLDLSGWDTSQVTDMSEMFAWDSSLTEVLLTGWDVSNVSTMKAMFQDCRNLESIGRDPASFSHGTSTSMYDGCEKLTVETAAQAGDHTVVRNSGFPTVSHAIDVHAVDWDREGDEVIELIKSSPVFGHPEIRRRDIASVEFLPTLEGAPEDAWDVSEAGDGRVLAWVTPDDKLYDLTIAGDGGVRIVDPPDASGLFSGMCNARSIRFNGCVDTSERQDFSGMFIHCHELKEIDFTGLCSDSAISFTDLFAGCWKLEAIDTSWINTASAKNLSYMFGDCGSLKALDVSGFDTHRATAMDYMFKGCESLETLDVSHFDTGRVMNMSWMFAECRNLDGLEVSGFDTTLVTDMSHMFGDCNSLSALDVSGFNTFRVRQMEGMFFGCQTLDALDMSKWNTGRVASMSRMFNGCKTLFRLDLSKFNTSGVTDLSKMFGGCENLVELNLAGWDISKVEDMSEMFDGCRALESIGRDPAEFARGNTANMYRNCEKLPGV